MPHDVFLNWGLWQRGCYPHLGLVNVPQTPHHVSNKTQMPVIAVSLSAEVQRYQTRLSFTATFGHHSCTPMVPVDSRGTNDFLLVFHCDRRSGWNRYPVIDGKPSKSADSNHHEWRHEVSKNVQTTLLRYVVAVQLVVQQIHNKSNSELWCVCLLYLLITCFCAVSMALGLLYRQYKRCSDTRV